MPRRTAMTWSMDRLEPRLLKSAMASAYVRQFAVDDDPGEGGDDENDPPPIPGPPPRPGRGDEPPIVYPILPPSGPSGPAS
jgi:hypothetical protein